MDNEKDVNIELAKGVANEAVKEIQEERSFAYDLLQEFKTLNKRLYHIIIGLLIAIAVCNIAWVWLWNQYDYSTTIDAVGVYTAVDKSGNIITQDVTEEQWKLFMEWLNGQDTSN